MRLDLFLKVSRLVKSRTLAQEYCDAGRISINGSRAKSSKEVRAGDEIEIRRRNNVRVVRIESVPDRKQVSRDDASLLYKLIRDETLNDGSGALF